MQIAQVVSPQMLGEFAQVLKMQLKNVNKYFYIPVVKLRQKAEADQNDTQIFKVEEAKDENQIAREQAQKIEDIERNNIDTVVDAVKTDWTQIDANKENMAKNLNDAVNDDFGYFVEGVSVEDHTHVAQQLKDLRDQIPETGGLSVEQMATLADELMKRSGFIYQTLITSFYNKVNEHRSQIQIFSKCITFPTSKIYLRFAPRNIFDTLPHLLPREKYETEEKYITDRRRILSQLAEVLAEEIKCKVSYGAPSYGPLYNLQFESCSEFMSLSGEQVPPSITSVREQLEERQEVVLVSTSTIPAFWIADADCTDVVNAHCNFVQTSKLLLAGQDADAHEAIMMSNCFISLASYLPAKDKVKIDKQFLDSGDLNISSPHPDIVDTESIIASDKQAKSSVLSKMYKIGKQFKNNPINFRNGIINTTELSDLNLPDDIYTYAYEIRRHGVFAKATATTGISNFVIEPIYKFCDKQHARIMVPKISFSFRTIEDTFNFGQLNVVPSIDGVRGSFKTYMSGMSYSRLKSASGNDPDGAPAKLQFPARIFSHILLKVDRTKGAMRVGYVIDGQNYRISLNNGQVELPPKSKLQAQVFNQVQLKPNDQICCHYLIEGKKFTASLHIKLLRGETITEVGCLEVPDVACQFQVWLCDENDSINIVKSRLNVICQRDIRELEM